MFCHLDAGEILTSSSLRTDYTALLKSQRYQHESSGRNAGRVALILRQTGIPFLLLCATKDGKE